MTIYRSAAQTLIQALALAVSLLFHIKAVSAPPDRFDTLQLNGLAAYTQLRNEYYIGALYVEQRSADAGTLLTTDNFQRMQLRITIDRWSPRRFASQWNQYILINNEQATINKFANQILQFIDMPREELIAGDIITIDRDPKLGTNVYLNDYKVIQETDNAFYTLLLSSWIGLRPPSSDFKNNLLTLDSDPATTEQLRLFQRLKPTSVRAKKIAGWFAPKAESATPQTADAQGQTADDRTANPPAENAQASAKPELVTAAKGAVEKPLAAANVTAAELQSLPTATGAAAGVQATLPGEPATPAAATTNNSSAKAQPAAKQPVAVAIPPAANLAQQQEAEKEAQKVLLYIYRANIMKQTYLNTTYPELALLRDQEDSIVLTIELDRNGKLLDIIETTKSKFNLLNDAAREAVQKSAPYPAPPDDLKGDTILVRLPFEFQITD